MNQQELKESLKEYKLLLFADIATVSHSPTAAYKLLQTVYKESYDPNERIVFYGNQVDADLFNHVARARDLLDIGEFFCLYQDNVEDADQPGEGYRVNKDTFCPLLWGHLEVRHNGDVYPCCVSKELLGNGNTTTLSEIYYGPQMERIRSELLSGIRSPGCEKCWRLDDQNLYSNRQWQVERDQRNFYREWYDDLQIRSLDLKPGNVCNFLCRTCNPTSSSAIADEWRRSQRKSGVFEIISDRWDGYNEFMWAELDSVLPTIRNLDFYGGEPFLLKELKGFLTRAVEQGHADHIRLHLNSNGSVWPEDIIGTILKFKEVNICLSIDDIGTRFEIERGGVWADVEENILKFKALEADNPNFEMNIFPTVNIQNIYYLGELLDWAEQHRIEYVLNYLDTPEHYNIDYMTNAAKELVYNKYHNHKIELLRNLAQRIKSSTGSDGSAFRRQVGIFDRMRKQNFAQTHPEFSAAMGYQGPDNEKFTGRTTQ